MVICPIFTELEGIPSHKMYSNFHGFTLSSTISHKSTYIIIITRILSESILRVYQAHTHLVIILPHMFRSHIHNSYKPSRVACIWEKSKCYVRRILTICREVQGKPVFTHAKGMHRVHRSEFCLWKFCMLSHSHTIASFFRHMHIPYADPPAQPTHPSLHSNIMAIHAAKSGKKTSCVRE